MFSPVGAAMATARAIFSIERRPGGTGVTEAEEAQFCYLADRLYKELDEPTGGPLHCELEDGNINHMVGEAAEKHIYTFINALRLIAEGNAPTSDDHRFREEYHLAHHYRDNPEVLRCAIGILEITRHWNEDDAEPVYDRWSEAMYGDGGWLDQHWRRVQ